MTQRELIDICLELPQAYEDYPFDDVTPVLRHGANKKMFALVGDVPIEEVKRQIEASYDLIKPKMRKRKRNEGD